MFCVDSLQGPPGMSFYHYKAEQPGGIEPFDNFLLAAVLSSTGYDDESCRPVPAVSSLSRPGRAVPAQLSVDMVSPR